MARYLNNLKKQNSFFEAADLLWFTIYFKTGLIWFTKSLQVLIKILSLENSHNFKLKKSVCRDYIQISGRKDYNDSQELKGANRTTLRNFWLSTILIFISNCRNQ